MFTGIVEEQGEVLAVEDRPGLRRLRLRGPVTGPGLALGDSIAVNGVCLTAVAVCVGPDGLDFAVEAVPETLRRSNLGLLAAGDPVNLERSLTPSSRMGGHFVQGHVEGTGRVVALQAEGESVMVEVAAPPDLLRLVVPKGFIAIDGASLTVVELRGAEGFTVALIPYTLAHSVAGRYRPGTVVNLETDILSKTVERLIRAHLGRGDEEVV